MKSADSRPVVRSPPGGLPRIALLTDGLYPYCVGGMQRHSRLLAESLAHLGVELTVFHTASTPESIDAARAGRDRSADAWGGIDLRFIDSPPPGRYPGHYLADCWRYSAALLRAYGANRPRADFIYAQGLTGLAFVRARRQGVDLPPIGINAHGYHMFQAAGGLRGWLIQCLYAPTFVRLSRDADFVFTFSHRVRDVVTDRLRIPIDRILEVPNAIDDPWIVAGIRPCGPRRRFLFVGRHDRLKGLPELHRAIQAGRFDTADFHFVGPIPESERLSLPNCTYLGPVTDTSRLQACFDEADVLLCPSHAEGMPTVILEALARGLAVIATDVGAVRSMVDETNGIVLERPDYRRIADAIGRLVQCPEEVLTAMKQASLNKSPLFGWRAVAIRTVEAVQAALSLTEQSRGRKEFRRR